MFLLHHLLLLLKLKVQEVLNHKQSYIVIVTMIVSVIIVIMMCLLGSSTGNSYIIYVISGSIGTCALALFIILALCVIIGRRQVRKKRDVLNAGR